MKTSLVTGAGGWIGLELVKRLLDDGQKVKALDRSYSEKLNKLEEEYKDRLLVIKGDMTKISDWKDELKDVDYLFHLAAKVHSKPNNEEEAKEFYLINRDCTKELFDIALKYKIGRIVFISTVAVYGNHEDKVIDTNTPRNPNTPYAISKNDAEIYGLELYKQQNFPITIIQPVTVYGGNDVGNFKKLYNLAKKGFVVRFGNGENKKTVIHYVDLVKQIKSIAYSKDTKGKTFICGVESISYNTISKKMKNSANSKFILNVPIGLSKLLIRILNIVKVPKLSNIASNIETLMKDNVYNYEYSLKYINQDESISFEKWNCKKEYGI